ncbi:cyclin-like protein [Mycena olivaceomarginata]|nr:cyclin-like protein [Mycena olivaceomarginata]
MDRGKRASDVEAQESWCRVDGTLRAARDGLLLSVQAQSRCGQCRGRPDWNPSGTKGCLSVNQMTFSFGANGAIWKRRKEPLRELTNGATSSQGEEQKLLKKPTTETRRPLSSAKDSDENARPPVYGASPVSRCLPDCRSFVSQGKKEVHADTDESTSTRQRISYLGPEDWTEVARERDSHSDGDCDGPTMASEDIQCYLRDVELNTMPNPNYMNDQPKLTWEMRGVLNDWLIQVHARFRLNPETLFLCTNLIDRFLSTRAVRPSKLQLVGVVCLLVAAKFEENISPSVASLIFVCDHVYTCKDILQAEQHVLSALGWDLSYPSPMNYLHCISKADGYDPRIAR